MLKIFQKFFSPPRQETPMLDWLKNEIDSAPESLEHLFPRESYLEGNSNETSPTLEIDKAGPTITRILHREEGTIVMNAELGLSVTYIDADGKQFAAFIAKILDGKGTVVLAVIKENGNIIGRSNVPFSSHKSYGSWSNV